MSFLNDEIKIKKVQITPELYTLHRKELLDLLVTQYFRKDPTSYASSYEILLKYFQEEYDEIFTTDKSFISGFLYFDAEGSLVGTFMFRDAYISCKSHELALEKMTADDSFYGYYVELKKHTNEFFQKYDLKEGSTVYGTNLAFSAKFLENFKGKKVLYLIFAVFLDLSEYWEKYLSSYKYAIWVQLRQSLYSITMKMFNCIENREFVFIGDDKIKYEGKVFLVQRNNNEELKKLWDTLLA